MKHKLLVNLVVGIALLRGHLRAAETAELSGVVKSPEGPVNGAVVKARKGNIALAVITNSSGRYEIPGLEAGIYTITAAQSGRKPVEKAQMELKAGKNTVDLDFGPEKDLANQLTWADFWTWSKTQPPDPDRTAFEMNCNQCHGLNFILAQKRNEAGWRGVLQYMNYIRTRPAGSERYREGEEGLVRYLTKINSPSSPPLPAIPPAGAPIKEEASRVIFKEYYTSPRGTVHTMAPDAKGNVWFSSWLGVKDDFLGKLNTKTGEVTKYVIGTHDKHTHGVCVDDKRNAIWFTNNLGDQVGMFDENTEKFKLFDAPGYPHSCLIDPDGNVWVTINQGNDILKIEGPTGKMTRYPVPTPKSLPYGIIRDPRNGVIWFAEAGADKVAKLEPKTGQFTEFEALTKHANIKRLGMDSKGNVWWGAQQSHKLGRIDAKTGRVTEYEPPTKYWGPYGLVVDHNDMVWIAGFDANRLMRFDPSNESWLEIPFSSLYSGVRVMDVDSQGRIWMAGSTWGQVLTIDFK